MKPIGGFFDLELPPPGSGPHPGAVALSTGRACMALWIREVRPARCYVPFYCCNALIQPLLAARFLACWQIGWNRWQRFGEGGYSLTTPTPSSRPMNPGSGPSLPRASISECQTVRTVTDRMETLHLRRSSVSCRPLRTISLPDTQGPRKMPSASTRLPSPPSIAPCSGSRCLQKG